LEELRAPNGQLLFISEQSDGRYRGRDKAAVADIENELPGGLSAAMRARLLGIDCKTLVQTIEFQRIGLTQWSGRPGTLWPYAG
jgi:hypothetical protein